MNAVLKFCDFTNSELKALRFSPFYWGEMFYKDYCLGSATNFDPTGGPDWDVAIVFLLKVCVESWVREV